MRVKRKHLKLTVFFPEDQIEIFAEKSYVQFECRKSASSMFIVPGFAQKTLMVCIIIGYLSLSPGNDDVYGFQKN